jgi:hypothetical protein
VIEGEFEQKNGTLLQTRCDAFISHLVIQLNSPRLQSLLSLAYCKIEACYAETVFLCINLKQTMAKCLMIN